VDLLGRESVVIKSLGEDLSGVLFLADGSGPRPVLIICHGAGEFKENYFELSEYLARRGFSSLTLDMHGHGASGGERFHVNIDHWVADIGAAVQFLSQHHRIDPEQIGAFGLSSGGTAILEAALVNPKLKVLITLDATVRNSLPLGQSLFFRVLIALAKVKRLFTGSDWRIPLLKLSGELHLASDPVIDRRFQSDPKMREPFLAFPLPGAAQAFFVDTLCRVPSICVPTLVIWGEEDKVDPPETARQLFAALRCRKELHIISGNGHLGHLDRQRDRVFELTAAWMSKNLSVSPLSNHGAWQDCENDFRKTA
jgi:uncharacterized protein